MDRRDKDQSASYNGDDRNSAQQDSNNNGDAKGKGREKSISGRLQASGRMAANAAFGTQGLASAAAGSDKTGHWNHQQRATAEFALGESSRLRSDNGAGESLKAQGGSTMVQKSPSSFDEFMNESPHLAAASPLDPVSKGHAIQTQEQVDGSDVVGLLSQPDEPPSLEDLDNSISEPEAARLREALFTQGSRQPVWDDLLNFNPDFSQPAGSSDELVSHFGLHDPEAARDVWLQQWGDVLTRYTDEVWGDLGSLATKARQEIDDLANRDHSRSGSSETKALDRLRQILAHVRGAS